MLVVKSRHPRETYERVFLDTWRYSFVTHVNIQEPAGLAKLLAAHFDEAEVKEIMRLAATREFKEKLTADTKKVLDMGAFGAPWFWVTNQQGKGEPVFGSDRWVYMWRMLGVEFEDLRIVDKNEKEKENGDEKQKQKAKL
jgi:2-hydroxychromene-2-carboxylate isomerase